MCAHAENICIVVHPCKACASCVCAKCCSNAAVLVCRHAHSDTGGAEKKPELGSSLGNLLADLVGIYRIVNRFGCIGSEIVICNVVFFKVLFKLLLKLKSSVIASDCDRLCYFS